MPDQPPHTASRRRLLAGLGAVMATPAIVAATGGEAAATSSAEATERASEAAPECLSDLVAMGVVTHDADFMAG